MPAFDVLLRQTATLYAKTGRDQYAKPTYGAGIVVGCRFDPETKIKLMINNQETITDAWMMIDPGVTVADHDKILGPDGLSYRVILVNAVPDKYGDGHHTELGLQQWEI